LATTRSTARLTALTTDIEAGHALATTTDIAA
jgi:hypothetical protein